MYLPRHFRQDDPNLLSRAMQRFAAATLVSQGADGLLASHMPIEVIAAPAPQGLLRCHLARTNPHAESLAQDGPLLAISTGREVMSRPIGTPQKLIMAKSCRPGTTPPSMLAARP